MAPAWAVCAPAPAAPPPCPRRGPCSPCAAQLCEWGDAHPRGRGLKVNVPRSSLTPTSVVSPGCLFSRAVTCNSDSLELGFSDPVWLNALWGLPGSFLGSQTSLKPMCQRASPDTGDSSAFQNGCMRTARNNVQLIIRDSGRGEKLSTVLEEVWPSVGIRCWLTLPLLLIRSRA